MYFLVVVAVNSNPYLNEQKKIINGVAKSTGLIPIFPNYDIENPQFDLQSAFTQLKSSTFVLADLTYERPSCYYELGLAEALTKPVYAVAQTGTAIHQTTSREKVSFYKDLDQFKQLVTEIFFNVSSS